MNKNPKKCVLCFGGLALDSKYALFDDELFWVVCDGNPLIEGHILIIPKEHISCMGALNETSFEKYKKLYEKVLNFLNKSYGQVGVFEHGISGQTVFHAHTHFLPFDKSITEVVPEKETIHEISTLDEIRNEFNEKQKYLYVSVNDKKWVVDTDLGFPRFFRDRFAKVLGVEERSNWKKAREDHSLENTFDKEIKNLKNKWHSFFQ